MVRLRTRRNLLRVVAFTVFCLLALEISSIIKPPEDAVSYHHDHTEPHHDHTVTKSAPASTSNKPDPVVLVAMVTYQRSGSSFLGEIFNQNPSAFEWFEPLDGLYSAMFGTEYGHNVPADIWNNWDGTPRVLPDFEVEALAYVTRDILLCKFSSLPTEVLLHQFIGMFINEHKKLKPYFQCTSMKPPVDYSGKTLSKCKICNNRLAKFCGKRFGQDKHKQSKCAQILSREIFKNNSEWKKTLESSTSFTYSADSTAKKAVDNYRYCMKGCREKALSCLPHLTNACESASVRAIKPVRFPMIAAKRLQEILPQVKIIHNLRDPRGVVFSRKNTSSSFQAAYAGALLKPMNRKHDMVKEAKLLCRNMMEDVSLFKEMSQKRPDSMMQVVYENYATQPEKTAEVIYNILNLSLPRDVTNWLRVNTQNGTSDRQTTRNSSLTSSRWQRHINPNIKVNIDKACSDLLSQMGPLWESKQTLAPEVI